VTWTLADLAGRTCHGQAARTPARPHTMPADAEMRRLIREGFEYGIPGEQLAEAAGLSLPRVYQIRDGRR
jgi:hypothetical protein